MDITYKLIYLAFTIILLVTASRDISGIENKYVRNFLAGMWSFMITAFVYVLLFKM